MRHWSAFTSVRHAMGWKGKYMGVSSGSGQLNNKTSMLENNHNTHLVSSWSSFFCYQVLVFMWERERLYPWSNHKLKSNPESGLRSMTSKQVYDPDWQRAFWLVLSVLIGIRCSWGGKFFKLMGWWVGGLLWFVGHDKLDSNPERPMDMLIVWGIYKPLIGTTGRPISYLRIFHDLLACWGVNLLQREEISVMILLRYD